MIGPAGKGVNRVPRRDDTTSVSRRIGEKNPGRQIETVRGAGSLKARANSRKSGSINFVRRGSRRTVMKKSKRTPQL